MKIRTLSLILVMAMMEVSFVVAAPIDVVTARKKVAEYMVSSRKKVKGDMQLSLATTIEPLSHPGQAALYAFNIGKGHGFVIAPADDSLQPVLGCCDHGSFHTDSLPDNMREWLDGYAKEILLMQEHGETAAPPSKVKVNAAAEARSTISELLESKWDQISPYNDQCIFNGERCLTGCVATAMAQVLYYWATKGRDGNLFRPGCTALAGYQSYNNNLEDYMEIPPLDALETFDWDHMQPQKHTTAEEKAAVAQLMRYCGQSLETTYSGASSGAGTSDVATALGAHFDYNVNISVIRANAFTTLEWESMIYSELSKGQPVLMSGGGHAFVCDGYDANSGQFHFNWGWGGNYDGWFSMTALTPSNHNYSSGKMALININPFAPLDASPYAIFSEDNTEVTFYYDNKYKEREGRMYPLVDGAVTWGWSNSGYDEYGEPSSEVTHVVFDPSFIGARPKTTMYWFSEMKQLTSITGLHYLNCDSVTNMSSMFENCSSLKSIDLSVLNTSKVRSMEYMFDNCVSLESIDLSGLNTSNVTNMGNMFWGCSNLKSINFGSIDTSNVTNIKSMFSGCSSLESIDLSGLNIAKVTSLSSMFYGCTSLESIDLSGLNTAKVTSMSSMFGFCPKLKTVNLNNLKTDNLTSMSGMFSGCSSLEEVDLSPINTSKVKSASSLFNGCSKLQSVNLGNFDASYLTNAYWMFKGCANLQSLDLSNWNTSNVTNMESMFSGCTKLQNLNLSGWDTSNVTDMNSMFYKCTKLQKLDLSFFDVGNVTDVSLMFSYCSSLKDLKLGKWNVSNLTNMSHMFSGCSNLERLDWNFINATNVENMEYMFYDCSQLRNIQLSNIDMSNVSNNEEMFSRCLSLKRINLPSNLKKVGEYMFALCESLESMTLPEGVDTIGSYAFYKCKRLKEVSLPSSVITIEDNAFMTCDSLIYVIVNWRYPLDITEDIFPNRQNAYLYVPYGSWEYYYLTRIWRDFKEIRQYRAKLVGDVNYDNKLSVTDVMLLVNYILGKENHPFSRAKADINSDGRITVTDVTQMVSAISGRK